MQSHMNARWVVVGLMGWALAGGGARALAQKAQEPSLSADHQQVATVVWSSHYGEALRVAEREKKMLLMVFHHPEPDRVDKHFHDQILTHPEIQERLRRYVCVRLPVNTTIRLQGKPVVLLEHSAFEAMRGRPGVVVIDYAHPEAAYYGCVVGAFPFAADACYSVQQMKVILDLPPGHLVKRHQWYVERMRRWAEQFFGRRLPPEIPLRWYEDYRQAYRAAYQSGRMLLLLFADPESDSLGNRFEKEVLADPTVREKLAEYVLAKLPRDARLEQGGEVVVLLKHPAFSEMLGLEGMAIIDLAHRDQKQYGTVVSVFPFLGGRLYTLEQTKVILSLPPGTLTQRTLIYAVRTHPERPASTTGQFDPILAQEAENHSAYQARIRLQGHHHWDSRFHRISQQLPGGLLAQEVCAESWPGQNLLEAAIECVRCWRLSSGHWSAVQAAHPRYGYDMKKGDNGVWYATGIFARSVR